MFPAEFIFVGVFVNLLGSLWYLKEIVYGQTKPNLVSWFVWMLAPFVGFILMIKAGAGLGSLAIFMSGFGPFLVILFSIFNKKAYWKITAFDLFCGALALFALVLYVFTQNLGVSIVFAILSDLLAAIPTVIKAWRFPETETSSTYIAGIFNNIIALLIIKNWIFPIYSFSIYIVLINVIIVFCIYNKKFIKIDNQRYFDNI